MEHWILCASVFVAAYLLNVTYISIFYHRALAHQSVRLTPWLRKFVVATGNWVTGLDPKGWVCMHRLHHQYSDTALDPHSPQNAGIIGTMMAQLKGYRRVLKNLIHGTPSYVQTVRDLDFEVNWLNRKKLWIVPYLVHIGIGVALAVLVKSPALGLCYFYGMMTHPIQGWMVNAFGHSKGYRNFAIDDHSTNNTAVAWLVFGEGLQNNHHRYPQSARFSVRWFEVDSGYGMAKLFNKLGLLEINQEKLAPKLRSKMFTGAALPVNPLLNEACGDVVS